MSKILAILGLLPIIIAVFGISVFGFLGVIFAAGVAYKVLWLFVGLVFLSVFFGLVWLGNEILH